MDLFNFIKQHVDILTVIGEYTSLKKTGSLYWKARCPFHHENTPSFTVSPHKNIFYCFCCHMTGDVIGFIEKIENLTALEAAQHLALRYHLELPKEIGKSIIPALKKSHFQLCYTVALWCNSMLLKHPLAINYLKKRKLSAATCTQFLLGYFPAGARGIEQLLAHVSPLGFCSQDLIDANIIFPGKQGLYSPFEDRIIFPIKDHLGQVCAFGGRIFLEHDTRPKYYNSKESSYFKKGKILYGFDVAKLEIAKQQAAILVEGNIDCIAMYQHGFKNVVATLGTACSPEHLQQLAKHAQKIYLLYDADEAGKQAIIRLTSSCWQLDLDLKVATLPGGQDPASMLELGQSIAPCIEQAQEIFNFFVQIKGDNFVQESMKNKMTVVHEMFELVAQVKDNLKCNFLLSKIAESLQIPLEIIKNEYTKRYVQNQPELKNQTKNQATAGKAGCEQGLGQIHTTDSLEDQILGAIAYDPNLLTAAYETLLLATLSPFGQGIMQKIIEHRQRQGAIALDLKSIFEQEAFEYLQRVMFLIDGFDLKQTFENLMLRFQKKYWKTAVSHIRMKIVQATRCHDTQEVARLLAVFEELKIELSKNGSL
ncbi:DNA primase [candidate division TM6 bacterium RIFCSPHIGHO2_12_FULL_38_8]|nr:MAG: DNA primase [candidate division TM6 bacterium RIFCSPHIGHO2_12_FULL_38_8]